MPDIFSTSDEVLYHKFQYAEGDNDVTTSIVSTDEKTFKQQTTVTIDGERYFLSADYEYDGKDFKATMTVNKECTYTWTKAAGAGNVDNWNVCAMQFGVMKDLKYDVMT